MEGEPLAIMERLIVLMIVGATGVGLTFARRYRSNNPDAGMVITFFTMLMVFLLALCFI